MNCSYCGNSGKMTREHVFPKFLLRSNENEGIFYSNATKGYFGADAVVKDTCSLCNNEKLAALDLYAKGVYEKYFSRVLVTSRTVTFDPEKFLRWVLKVTFNAQRGFNGSPRNLHHLRQYMLGEVGKPDSLIFLGVVMRRSYVDGKWKTPRDFRACDIRLDEGALRLETKFCHMLVINSFCFVVADLITKGNEARDKLVSFLHYQIGTSEITSTSTSFVFDSSISKIDHISHNISQSRQNRFAYPKSKEVVVNGTRRMLTGLPADYVIRRDRIRDAKHFLVTMADEADLNYAGVVLTEFPEKLRELSSDFRLKNTPTSKQCFAGIRRGENKTYLTLYDPHEPGVPHLSTKTGTEQSPKNWKLFRNAIIENGHRIFLTDEAFLKNSTLVYAVIEVISIDE